MIRITKEKPKDNIFIKIRNNEAGFSGCLTFLIIVLVLFAAGAGYIYFQWSNIKKLGSENIQKAIKKVEENEELENIEDIEDIDSEELEQIHPIVRRIFKLIPRGLIEKFQKSQNNNLDSSEVEKKETAEKQKLEITADELLPESIDFYPAFRLTDYQYFEDISNAVSNEIEMEEEYINKKSILIEGEVDFPEIKIEQLREMEEVSADISDSQIENNKDDLEYLYNIKKELEWYQNNLQENGWKIIQGEKKRELNIIFEHENDGYFIILDLENFLYTPKL